MNEGGVLLVLIKKAVIFVDIELIGKMDPYIIIQIN